MVTVKGNIPTEKEPFNSILPVLLILGVLISIVALLLTTIITTHSKNTQLKNHALRLTEEISQLRIEQSKLQKENTAINQDPFYLEFIIRKDLGMRKEGEILIRKK